MKFSHFVPLPNLKICFTNYLGKTIVNLGYTISLITPNSSEMGGGGGTEGGVGGGGEKVSSKKEKTLTNLAINIRLNLFFLLLLCTLFT